MTEGRVHPDCRNASNPYHECVEFCFLKIAELKECMEQPESDVKQGRTTDGPSSDYPDQSEDHHVQESGRDEHDNDNTQLTEWKKKLFKLKVKMDYQSAKEAYILEASSESRDRLDTQEATENKYKKCEKKPAPFDCESWEWDDPVSSQKKLYNANKKLTKNIECNVREYNKMKEADPESYSDASSSIQYGKAPKISEDKICKMVKELHDKDEEDMIYKMVKEILDKEEKHKALGRRRKFHEEKDIDSINGDMTYKMVKEILDKDEKHKALGRRRKFHEEKDIDSINGFNDHNENLNKIIERAYGKYSQEIKNNLERGTAALQGYVGAGLFTFCIGVAALNCVRVSIR